MNQKSPLVQLTTVPKSKKKQLLDFLLWTKKHQNIAYLEEKDDISQMEVVRFQNMIPISVN